MPSFQEWKAQQGAAAPPETSISDKLLDFAGRGAVTALETAMPVFDLMARPQTALSEAYGAYKSGEENEILAALRGFTEGWEGAKYSTFGEQFVPLEEGENFGRQAARFGIDVVTDPTNLLFFTGAGRQVIAKGLQKVATPALKKAGAVLKSQPWTQRAGRMVTPYAKLWGMFGDDVEAGITAGSQGGKLGTEGFEAIGIRLGKQEAEFQQLLKEAGAIKDSSKRKLLSDILDGTEDVAAADEGIQKVATFMRAELNRVADDAIGVDLKVFDPVTNNLRPFAQAYEADYVPRMLKHGVQDEIAEVIAALPDEQAARLAWANGPKASRMAKDIAKKLGMTEEQAQGVVKQYAVRPQRVGHLEMARSEFPEALEPFLERDAVEWFTRYMERSVPRIEMAKRFGAEYEGLQKLLGESMQAGMSETIAADITQIIKGVVPQSRFGMDELLRGALAVQTIGKLGPTTSLMNFGQKLNDGIKEGIGKMLKATGRTLAPSERIKHGHSYVTALRDQMRLMTGASNTTAKLPRAAQSWLKWVGFTPIERNNRIGSSIAGLMGAEDTAKKWSKLAAGELNAKKIAKMERLGKKLKAYGVPDDEIANFAKTGKFSEATTDLVGYRASQVAQHATHPWELPPGFRTPEMRLFLQFKRFAYNQSRFLYEQVAKPAYKWFETAGVEGDIMPFARAAMLFPVGGVTIGAGREGVKDLQAWFFGAKRRPSQYDFDNHPTASTMRAMMYVGSFGLAGDVLERSYRSGLADYFMGPTVSDLFDITERTTKAGYKIAAEGEYPTIEDMMLSLYQVGGRGALGMSPSELQTASTHRGLPGLITGKGQ